MKEEIIQQSAGWGRSADVLHQGAEAVLIKCGDELVKRRVEKGYRLKDLDDKLRRRRTRGESKLLLKAGKIINVPDVKLTDELSKEITMEFIDGVKLSGGLDDMENWEEVCLGIGEGIGKLHGEGIIHGDLTTSNLIWVERGKKVPTHPPASERDALKDKGGVYFIDFGLGYGNGRVEDKAVDLHLIRQALEAKHFLKWEDFFGKILEGYRKCDGAEEVLKRLEKVEKRGRYKQSY